MEEAMAPFKSAGLKPMNRRTILRGASAAIALPLLDAMVPVFSRAATARAASPCRMAFLYVPNGIIMDQWLPSSITSGGAIPLPAQMPRVSAALAGFRDDILMLGGL